MSDESNGGGKARNIAATIIGVAALTGFGLLIIYLLFSKLDEQELYWTRAVYLLSGVEAVAFAAAGFFFGRDVNRQRAESAENQAEEAQKEAKAAQGETARAQAQAAAEVQKTTDVKSMLQTLISAIDKQKMAQDQKASLYSKGDANETTRANQADLDILQGIVEGMLRTL